MSSTICIFGEAEKGSFSSLLFVDSLPKLFTELGNPPQESQGISYAIQALLSEYTLLFYRVKEEGFCVEDYLIGLALLEYNKSPLVALSMPGVGDTRVIEQAAKTCLACDALLIMNERDLYDYLTSNPSSR